MFIIDDLDLVKCFKAVFLFHQPYKHISLLIILTNNLTIKVYKIGSIVKAIQ